MNLKATSLPQQLLLKPTLPCHFFLLCDSQFLSRSESSIDLIPSSNLAYLFDLTPLSVDRDSCSPIPSSHLVVTPASSSSNAYQSASSQSISIPSFGHNIIAQFSACRYVPIDSIFIPVNSSFPLVSSLSHNPSNTSSLPYVDPNNSISNHVSYKLQGSRLISDSVHPSLRVSIHIIQIISKTKSLQALLIVIENFDALIDTKPKSIH